MLQRYLIIWLCLLSGVAYAWPDPFVASKPYLSWLIAGTMFSIGALLPRDEVNQVIRRWPTVLGGTTIQYATMPLLAFGCGHLFGLNEQAMIGIVIVGCVPGAMASNVLTLAARGNVSYSVSLTTSATLLSPLIVPLAMSLLLKESVLRDPMAVSIKLLREVVGPVVAGHVLSRNLPKFEQPIKKFAPVIANLAILWIIAYVVARNRDSLNQGVGTILAALLMVNLLGYAAGYSGGRLLRLPESMKRALTLEVGMQNAGVGTVLADSFFSDQPTVMIAPGIYTFGCMLTGTMLAQLWRRREPVEEAPNATTA